MSDATSELRGQAWRALVLICASIQFLVQSPPLPCSSTPAGPSTSWTRTVICSCATSSADLGATITPSRPSQSEVSHILLVIALGCVGLGLILASSNWRGSS